MSAASQLSLLPTDDHLAGVPPSNPITARCSRRWVVEFILDLVGYRPAEDLSSRTIVEPACGSGAFLIPIVDRLVDSCRRHGTDLALADNAIRAFEVLDTNADLTRTAVAQRLGEHGLSVDLSEDLAHRWVRTADFLLHEHPASSADFVVGNPPYIRLKDVPRKLSTAYRDTWPTMQGRSDIFVGFFKAGLQLLKADGVLGFICADRWMHNQYRGSTPAADHVKIRRRNDREHARRGRFEDEVSAYPAVVVVRNGEQQSVNLVETKATFDRRDREAVPRMGRSRDVDHQSSRRPRRSAIKLVQ